MGQGLIYKKIYTYKKRFNNNNKVFKIFNIKLDSKEKDYDQIKWNRKVE